MTLRNLGKSGLRVSLVGLGCNNFGGRMDLESSTKVIHKALPATLARTQAKWDAEIEATKSAASSTCSADLQGDNWGAKWFSDTYATILAYTCSGGFTTFTHAENQCSSHHWASGCRPRPVSSMPSKKRATVARSRGVMFSDEVAL